MNRAVVLITVLLTATPAFAQSATDQFFQQKADGYLDWFQKYGFDIVAKQSGGQVDREKLFCAVENGWLLIPQNERDYIDKAARHEVSMTAARMQMITSTYVDDSDKAAINAKCGIN